MRHVVTVKRGAILDKARYTQHKDSEMAQKPPKRSKHANPALMRAIYWAIMIGIVAIFAIVTLEAIIGIVTEAFA